MKNNGRNENTPPTLAQFHALIRQSAISRGMAIPKTDEEFALLEKYVASSKLPAHNFQDVLTLIQTGEVPKSKLLAFPGTVPDMEVVEEFAQAARNGAEIPEEIQRKMDADRVKEEQGRRKK